MWISGECKETPSTPVLSKLPKQVEPSCVLSVAVSDAGQVPAAAAAFTRPVKKNLDAWFLTDFLVHFQIVSKQQQHFNKMS